MKEPKPLSKKEQELATEQMLKLGQKIRRMSRKMLNLPPDFDVIKFVRENR